MNNNITEILEFIVKAIVTNKEDVAIREESTETSIVLHLSVAETDKGQVIGKQGRIINSIREIIKTSSRGMEKRYLVEIDE